MYRCLFVLLLSSLSMVYGGCRAGERSPRSPQVASDPARRPKLASVPSEGPPITEPNATITLRDATALALMHNPGLKIYPFELRAAEARVVQTRLLTNPELEVEIGEVGGSGQRSGFDGAETTIQLGQIIELAGKRQRRTRLASLEKELVRWDYESARLDVLRRVTQAFVAVLAAQDRLALQTETLELSRQAQSAVTQRVQAGKDSPVDALRADVVLSQSRIAVRKATAALQAARHRLAATWGAPEPTFQAVVGPFHEVTEPVFAGRAEELIAGNPDLAQWQTRRDRQRAALELERANATSDIAIAGGIQRFEETDDSALVFGLAVPIPLFDRNRAGIEEATANLGKTRQAYEAARVEMLAVLAEATSRLVGRYEEAHLLRRDVLPKAEQAYETARQGYRQGKFDYLYVLDTQRTFLETKAQWIDAVEAYHQARVDVERLIGQSLPTDIPAEPSTTNEPTSFEEEPHEK